MNEKLLHHGVYLRKWPLTPYYFTMWRNYGSYDSHKVAAIHLKTALHIYTLQQAAAGVYDFLGMEAGRQFWSTTLVYMKHHKSTVNSHHDILKVSCIFLL